MKYRKKPIVIDAYQWIGVDHKDYPEWMLVLFDEKQSWIDGSVFPVEALAIKTLEGTMVACPGDYIIRGVAGDVYPCKSDIFEAIYEAVSE